MATQKEVKDFLTIGTKVKYNDKARKQIPTKVVDGIYEIIDIEEVSMRITSEKEYYIRVKLSSGCSVDTGWLEIVRDRKTKEEILKKYTISVLPDTDSPPDACYAMFSIVDIDNAALAMQEYADQEVNEALKQKDIKIKEATKKSDFYQKEFDKVHKQSFQLKQKADKMAEELRKEMNRLNNLITNGRVEAWQLLEMFSKHISVIDKIIKAYEGKGGNSE